MHFNLKNVMNSHLEPWLEGKHNKIMKSTNEITWEFYVNWCIDNHMSP